jgi:DNA-binding transcriptional LysR family regulator
MRNIFYEPSAIPKANIQPISLNMRFDLTDLRLFVAVVDAGSITHGAAQANLSLPAASERLQQMEDSGRVKLLVRGRRGTVPTAAGEALVHHARLVFRQLAQMHGELGQHAKRIRTTVQLVANTAAMVEHLPAKLAPWLVCHPRIDVELKERRSSDIVKAVSAGLVEIGIISDAIDPTNLQVKPFADDKLVVVTSGDDALARERAIPFSKILNREFIGLMDGALHDYIQAQADRRGKRIDYRVRVPTFEGICRMAAEGVGIGIVSESAARKWRRSTAIASIELTDAWANRRLLICMRSQEDLPPITADLVKHLSKKMAIRSSA